ncbi:MAG TPA: hypothetical protein VMG31_16430 [Verrucomicrobiae bacterium]|nr:hypothetical protein [Verrucomicrobiae bacterium]
MKPAITLAVLAPVIAEVLMGSTRLSFIFVLIPEIMVWGLGAVTAREAVRRWRAGWVSLMLLGIALGVAEECVIQQTSLAPLVGVSPDHIYGRFFGVNWVWMLGLLVFESVWVVLVPVDFTEAIFAKRRDQPWLTNRGMVGSGLIFIVGSFLAWYLWTQKARPLEFHVPPYHPPMEYILAGVGAIALLVLAAFALRAIGKRSETTRTAGPAWLAAIVACLLAAPWFMVIGWAYGTMPKLPVWIAIASGLAWAAVSFLIFLWWTATPAWTELHSIMAATGALIASMGMGFLEGGWNRVDLIGKIILDAAALAGMVYLIRQAWRRPAA